jgi:pimeloyl-ACP methyl ester carboxylesterase
MAGTAKGTTHLMARLTLPGGARLAYREAGSGAPLILVHGSPGDGRSWFRVVPRLTERHRVLMPDLPGYGGSDPPPGGASERTSAMGAAIGKLIEACSEPVRLFGHSYGGNVALHAALKHPDRVDSLALFEPVFFRALDLAGDVRMLEPAERFFAAYADRVADGEPAAVGEMIDYWFGPGAFTRLPASVQSFLTGAAAKNGLDVRAAFAEQITAGQLAGYAKPVLVACGSASPPVAPAIAKALVALMPLARLHPIPAAGHGMLDSHPDAVADLILAEAEG